MKGRVCKVCLGRRGESSYGQGGRGMRSCKSVGYNKPSVLWLLDCFAVCGALHQVVIQLVINFKLLILFVPKTVMWDFHNLTDWIQVKRQFHFLVPLFGTKFPTHKECYVKSQSNESPKAL